MTVYIIVCRTKGFDYSYYGVARTEEKARDMLQDIVSAMHTKNDIMSFEEIDYDDYVVFIIDGVQFEIWEEVI